MIKKVLKWLLIITSLISIYRYFVEKRKSYQLPLRLLGFFNLPAYPFDLEELVKTLGNIAYREGETKQAKAGLTNIYTIKGVTANAYKFLFDSHSHTFQHHPLTIELKSLIQSEDIYRIINHKDDLISTLGDLRPTMPQSPTFTHLFLDEPSQFSLSWTTFGGLYDNASKQLLPLWSKSLKDSEEATKQFWLIIANYSAAYNLLVVQKVNEKNYLVLKESFSKSWTSEMDDLYKSKSLYIVDLRIFQNVKTQVVDSFVRFTPSTVVWLRQDKVTKDLLPFAIEVSGFEGVNAQLYFKENSSSSSWLYALQAAKTSLTVYGIWIGHVYHWHIVTASMIMTMQDNIPEKHPLYQMLAPQSQHTIGFNDALAFLWKIISPPTSISSSYELLELLNIYAEDRQYFDDDPINTLQKCGIQKEDFTSEKDWDKFPMVSYYLRVWDIVEKYVSTLVRTIYKNDYAVSKDTDLNEWIKEAGDPCVGNINGLPAMNSQNNLIQVLTSLLYRITIHGIPNLGNTLNPALTFVANYPPCLQKDLIPDPQSDFNAEELLQYLPNTGVLGEMVNFYFTFVNTAPYNTFVPLEGVSGDLFFNGGVKDPKNQALVQFRQDLIKFIQEYTEENCFPDMPTTNAQFHQWSLSVEV
jgi:Lipoxygenase